MISDFILPFFYDALQFTQFDTLEPLFAANSIVGSSQNFAPPSGDTMWKCIRRSSREKKKKR